MTDPEFAALLGEGRVFVQNTEPSDPEFGDHWFVESGGEIDRVKVYDGTQFLPPL